jgi:hypothetical protein
MISPAFVTQGKTFVERHAPSQGTQTFLEIFLGKNLTFFAELSVLPN